MLAYRPSYFRIFRISGRHFYTSLNSNSNTSTGGGSRWWVVLPVKTFLLNFLAFRLVVERLARLAWPWNNICKFKQFIVNTKTNIVLLASNECISCATQGGGRSTGFFSLQLWRFSQFEYEHRWNVRGTHSHFARSIRSDVDRRWDVAIVPVGSLADRVGELDWKWEYYNSAFGMNMLDLNWLIVVDVFLQVASEIVCLLSLCVLRWTYILEMPHTSFLDYNMSSIDSLPGAAG